MLLTRFRCSMATDFSVLFGTRREILGQPEIVALRREYRSESSRFSRFSKLPLKPLSPQLTRRPWTDLVARKAFDLVIRRSDDFCSIDTVEGDFICRLRRTDFFLWIFGDSETSWIEPNLVRRGVTGSPSSLIDASLVSLWFEELLRRILLRRRQLIADSCLVRVAFCSEHGRIEIKSVSELQRFSPRAF